MWLPLFVIYFFILWLFVLRPQKRQEARRRSELGSLAKNDTVVTQGGIIGVVVQIKEDEVILRVDDKTNTRLRIRRSHLAGKYEAKPESPDEAAAS